MVSIQEFSVRSSFAAVISLYLAKRGYDKSSLNFYGALLAVVVGFVVSIASYAFFACLFTFFVTSSMLTKWKAHRKALVEEGFKSGGQRDAVQVFCNGGIAVIICLFYISEVGCSERPIDFSRDYTAAVLITSLIGSFACCNGDTWSSEIGTAIGSDSPRLITNFSKVPIGTNGGVTLTGTIAAALGGLVIGIAYLLSERLLIEPSMLHASYPPQWPVLLLATFAGLVGSLVDSLLGAKLQYSGFCLLRKKVVAEHSSTSKYICGKNVLNNDQVNLLSSFIMAIVTPIVAYYLWPYYTN